MFLQSMQHSKAYKPYCVSKDGVVEPPFLCKRVAQDQHTARQAENETNATTLQTISYAMTSCQKYVFFLHRFGHDTMPIFNLVKNCSYYYGFAAYVAYFVNHPLYTPPNQMQSLVCFALALACQFANLRYAEGC